LNNKLIKLYEKYWDHMLYSLQGKNLSNPLLIHIKDEEKYQKADIKIMFFGQETNSWYGELGSKSVKDLLHCYSDFLGSTYSSQFWNAVRDYVSTIQDLNPNKSVEFVWNNILKIGKENSKGKPQQDLVELQKEVFPVIREEVEILKPDLIVFFTGPYYDTYIKKEWNGVVMNEASNYKIRQLAIMQHPSLPLNSYRIYHPNFLYRQGKEFYSNVKNTIITHS
jgi:hypothetical protein